MQAFPILWAMAVKGTAILCAAWLAARLMRGRSAAARHMVWTAAMAALLALPALNLVLPSLDLPVASLPGSSVLFEVTATARGGGDAGTAKGAGAGPVQATSAKPASAPFDWRWWAVTMAAAGSLLLVIQMLAAHAALRRLRRRARPFAGETVTDAEVFESAAVGVPMTAGLVRPAILMPAEAASWTEDRRRMVLLHEQAHIQRGDLATQLLARLAAALHWWNPLVWVAFREFVKERERAADDLVLMSGARASDYAGHLLEVARGMRSTTPLAWAAVAMARPSQLEGRLLAILDAGRSRRAASPKAALAAALAAVVLVSPFAAVRAQSPVETANQAEIDATIRAAAAQKNHEMLEQAAAAYEKLRKYDAAQRLLESALAIRGDVSGQQSRAYAIGLMKLGDLEIKRGKYAEGERFYSQAIALGDIPEVVPALIELGMRAYAQIDDPRAADLFQRALTADPGGPKAGAAATWLANVRGRHPETAAEAESLYLQAMTLEDPASFDTAMTLDFYSFFLKAQGRDVEATAAQTRARDIRRAAILTLNQSPSSRPSFRVGGGISAPHLVSKMEPEYTQEARAARYQGTVLLSVVVDTDGIARDITITRGLGLGLDEKAAEAVSNWRFEPGRDADGNPTRVKATIEVNFRLM